MRKKDTWFDLIRGAGAGLVIVYFVSQGLFVPAIGFLLFWFGNMQVTR